MAKRSQAEKDAAVNAFLEAIDASRKLAKITNPDFGKYYGADEYDEDHMANRERLDILGLVNGDAYSDADKITAELIKQNYDLEVVEVFGGGEGDGETHYYVTRMGTRFFKLPACYNSYDDSIYYWDDVHEVKPKKKTITVYE